MKNLIRNVSPLYLKLQRKKNIWLESGFKCSFVKSKFYIDDLRITVSVKIGKLTKMNSSPLNGFCSLHLPTDITGPNKTHLSPSRYWAIFDQSVLTPFRSLYVEKVLPSPPLCFQFSDNDSCISEAIGDGSNETDVSHGEWLTSWVSSFPLKALTCQELSKASELPNTPGKFLLMSSSVPSF